MRVTVQMCVFLKHVKNFCADCGACVQDDSGWIVQLGMHFSDPGIKGITPLLRADEKIICKECENTFRPVKIFHKESEALGEKERIESFLGLTNKLPPDVRFQ